MFAGTVKTLLSFTGTTPSWGLLCKGWSAEGLSGKMGVHSKCNRLVRRRVGLGKLPSPLAMQMNGPRPEGLRPNWRFSSQKLPPKTTPLQRGKCECEREAAAVGVAFTLKITPLTVLTNELTMSAHKHQMKMNKRQAGVARRITECAKDEHLQLELVYKKRFSCLGWNMFIF